jgi:hypothetical protein
MRNCDSCNVALVPVFDDPMRRKDDFTAQYEGALGIQFLKGYMMFDDDIDDWNGVSKILIICHSCAHKLLDENPWMKKAINAEHSNCNC